MKVFNIIMVSLVGIQFSAAQIQVYVKTGNVTINDIVHKAGEVLTLKTTDKLMTGSSTNALAKNGKNLYELGKNKTYSYRQLKAKMVASTSFTDAFISSTTTQHVTKIKNGGATSRGLEDDPLEYFPEDSLQVLCDSLLMEVSPNLKLITDIKLYRENGTDTLILSGENYTFWLKNLKPGTYFWEYRAKIGVKPYSFKNIFFVPQPEAKLEYSKQISEYETQLAAFSEDMRALLLEEFLLIHRWLVSARNNE